MQILLSWRAILIDDQKHRKWKIRMWANRFKTNMQNNHEREPTEEMIWNAKVSYSESYPKKVLINSSLIGQSYVSQSAISVNILLGYMNLFSFLFVWLDDIQIHFMLMFT